MTNEAKYSPCSYLGNGTTKDFPFSWKIFTEEDVIVTLENVSTEKQTIQKYGTDYNLTFSDVGGNVTFINAPTTDYKIIISRDVSEFQSTKYSTSPGFQSSEIEKSFDKVSCEIQEAYYTLNRAIKVKNGSTNLNLTVPEPEKNKTLVWNNEGTGLINSNLRIDELSGILQECREKANSAKISADNSKQSELNASENAEIAIQNANSAKESADFAKETVDGFDTHTAEKQAEFDNNATQKQSAFDTNYNSKLNTFNSNASTLTTTFNNNVTSKTNTFNSNASSKQSAFDTNATNKTNTFNNNAAQKQSLVNQKANEAEIWAEGTDQQVAALGGTHSAKVWAEQNSEGLNVGMSNLSEVGEKKLEAQKSYHTGQVLTDEKGLQYAKTLAHSTFDINKFEIVGSPTITEDGTIGVYSSNNYLRIANNIVSKMEGSSWKINFAGTLPNTNSTRIYNVTGDGANPTGRINIGRVNGNTNFFLQFYDSTNVSQGIYIDVKDYTGKDYIGYASYDGTNVYTIALSFDGGLTYIKSSKNIENKVAFLSSDLNIARAFNNITFDGGVVDLKQFSIIVDGVEIFNGNKTGLDVIKPDNYEVIGNPTITDDGVASGFSSTNNISSKDNIVIPQTSKSIEVIGSFVAGDKIATAQIFYNMMPFRAELANDFTRITFFPPNGLSGTFNVFSPVTKGDLVEYNYYIDLTTNEQIATCSVNGIVFTNKYTATGEFAGLNSEMLCSSTAYSFNGSIDLTSFKIYVDGNLVYQPCLKIPYTLSKTGSKIVPAYARNRVQDVYEQYGEALYYTLDEENNNYTLPMGEMYGMIGNNNGAPVYDNNKVVTVAENTDYPITQKGSVNVQLTSGTFTINGVELINETGNGLFPVNIGDVVKGTAGTMKFLPLKGV